jgi:hypothetical protein
MANGTFQILGLQTGLPNQGQNTLGPFTVSFTATEYDVVQNLVTGANSIAVPSTAGGIVIIPLATNVVTLAVGGIAIDPQGPTFINFDNVTPNVPATISITAGGSVAVGIRFT